MLCSIVTVKLRQTTTPGTRSLLLCQKCVGSLTSYRILYKKTTKSNHLQKSVRRQQFLLSYFKTPKRWSGRGLSPRPDSQQTAVDQMLKFHISKFYHDSEAFWSSFHIWFGFCPQASHENYKYSKGEKFPISPLKLRSQVLSITERWSRLDCAEALFSRIV